MSVVRLAVLLALTLGAATVADPLQVHRDAVVVDLHVDTLLDLAAGKRTLDGGGGGQGGGGGRRAGRRARAPGHPAGRRGAGTAPRRTVPPGPEGRRADAGAGDDRRRLAPLRRGVLGGSGRHPRTGRRPPPR